MGLWEGSVLLTLIRMPRKSSSRAFKKGAQDIVASVKRKSDQFNVAVHNADAREVAAEKGRLKRIVKEVSRKDTSSKKSGR
jgi:hypothetical protein